MNCCQDRKAALDHQAKLIILDNISRILPDLLKADDVARVIEFMKRIRQNIGASFPCDWAYNKKRPPHCYNTAKLLR